MIKVVVILSKLGWEDLEAQKEKKLLYTTFGFLTAWPKKKKKAVAIVSTAFHIILRKVPGARVFLVQKTTA